ARVLTREACGVELITASTFHLVILQPVDSPRRSMPRIRRPWIPLGSFRESDPGYAGGTIRAGVLTACRSVLLVRLEPLSHLMPAEGLLRLASYPVASRPSGLTPSLLAVWVSSCPVTGRFSAFGNPRMLARVRRPKTPSSFPPYCPLPCRASCIFLPSFRCTTVGTPLLTFASETRVVARGPEFPIVSNMKAIPVHAALLAKSI